MAKLVGTPSYCSVTPPSVIGHVQVFGESSRAADSSILDVPLCAHTQQTGIFLCLVKDRAGRVSIGAVRRSQGGSHGRGGGTSGDLYGSTSDRMYEYGS